MLVTRSEIARRLGVTRQAVAKWMRHSDFPKPVSGVAGAKLYDFDEVVAWKLTRPDNRGGAS